MEMIDEEKKPPEKKRHHCAKMGPEGGFSCIENEKEMVLVFISPFHPGTEIEISHCCFCGYEAKK